MINPGFDCPDCGCPNDKLIFYDEAPDGKGGKYKCPDCGRDTIWKEIKTQSMEEFFDMLKRDKANYDKANSNI